MRYPAHQRTSLFQNTSSLMQTPFPWTGAILLVALLIANLVGGESDVDLPTDKAASKIMREGSKLEGQLAVCRSNGERLVVDFAENENSLVALENLASQRILDAVSNDPTDKNWTLTGTLTEFKGRNFLLVLRASRHATIAE